MKRLNFKHAKDNQKQLINRIKNFKIQLMLQLQKWKILKEN